MLKRFRIFSGSDLPIYIWYESYPEHIEEGYKGRVSRVSPDSPFGSASLNLTNIKESDQGWYECKVVFLNRDPKQHKNGTWFHLDVHAPPRFSVTPEDIIYVNLGDSIILNCQADGTPTPEILWYKDANPVDPSPTVGIFNDGTELRISTIRHEDIGEYTCIARNGEGQVSHTARVIIAGGAVIMNLTGFKYLGIRVCLQERNINNLVLVFSMDMLRTFASRFNSSSLLAITMGFPRRDDTSPASGNSKSIKTSSKTNKIYQITYFLVRVCQNRLNHY
uniref:Ig-like domain-containing protein n=1 Tax=Glossina pallidipes TaxID=7398 RepID=A0A1A9ZJ23_GLOPL